MKRLIVVSTFLAALMLVGQAMAQGLPRVPIYDGSTKAGDFQIKPYVIVYTGDGTGALGGPELGHGNRLERAYGRLRWTSWTSEGARGYGDDRVDFCNPDCAAGKHNPYPINVMAFRPAVVHGRLLFTRVTVTYTRGRPVFNHHPFRRSYTLDAVYQYHQFSWSEEP
jgi:hypothetical protein